jgi:deoxyribodipyrimidine photo-lyase
VGAARRALQHYQFLRESLRDLAQQLRSCARLQLAVGEVPEVLARLHALQPLRACIARGNRQRPPTPATWPWPAGAAGRAWPGRNGRSGVVRRLPSREQWHGLWQAICRHLPAAAAAGQPAPLPWPDTWPAPEPWAC